MADCFTHSLCLLDVGTPESAARALDLYNQLSKDGASEDPPSDGFPFSIQPGHRGSNLWMHDDITGDPERLIQFVKRFAAEFHVTGRWGFHYAASRHIGSERISYWGCIGRNGSDGAMADIHRCSSDDPPAGPLGHSPSYGEDRRHPDLHR